SCRPAGGVRPSVAMGGCRYHSRLFCALRDGHTRTKNTPRTFLRVMAIFAQGGGGSMDRLLEELVALERSALDRWIKLDPQGYLDLQAPEVTYFDPFTERRVDGLDAMQMRLAPMKKMKPPFTDPRYDLIDPKVQR